MALYFAAQGAGRVGWPLAASLLRVGVVLSGAWMTIALEFGLAGTFLAVAAGFVVMGLVNATAFASGRMFPGDPTGEPMPIPLHATGAVADRRLH